MSQTIIIVGLGEVGKPLFEIVKEHDEVFGVHVDLTAPLKRCDVMHICFPFREQTFVSEVVELLGDMKQLLLSSTAQWRRDDSPHCGRIRHAGGKQPCPR